MQQRKYMCKYCQRSTSACCPECNVACCMVCGANVCPLCVRIKLAQIEQALRQRLVPWQYVDVTMMPLRRPVVAQVGNMNIGRDDASRRTVFYR